MTEFPLSYPQKDWCRNAEAGAFGPRFIIPQVLRVTGAVDVGALRGALDDLVARHEILRTEVVVDGAPPCQRVHAPSPVPFEVCDVAPEPGRTREEQVEQILLRAGASSLDVAERPLLRAALHRFDAADSLLTLVTHHSAGDGWSTQLLRRDLADLYRARVTGTPSTLPVPRQYREFALWQQDAVEGATAEERRAYWRTKLDGAEIFALPTDRPIPEEYKSSYISHNHAFDEDLTKGIRDLAAATRSSVFTILLAALQVLAHGVNGTTSPVINTLFAGRGDPSFRDTVGSFLNFLPLRTDLDTRETFQDVLARARRACLEAYAYELPVEVVEQDSPDLMRPIHDPANSDFIFGFSRTVVDDEFAIGDGARYLPMANGQSSEIPGSTVWNLALVPSGEILGAFQYNPDIFDSGTVHAWTDRYRRLVAAAVADPGRAWTSL